MENRPWLANYPSGVPANVNVEEFNSIVEFAEDCFKKYKSEDAFENFGKRITYGELDTQSLNFAAYLQSRGLEPGQKIALMMPNLLQYPIAIFGALRAGLIVVNTNPLYTVREMEHQFKDSDVSAIVIAENFASNLEKVLEHVKIKTRIITPIGDLLGMKGKAMNFVLKNVKRAIPKYNIDNTVTFKQALADGKKYKYTPVKTRLDDVILHQYTGGTTGVSKGAMLTNKNLVANMLQTSSWLKSTLSSEKEQVIALSPLPMYHIFAFAVNCLGMMRLGALTVLVSNPRDIGGLVKEFNKNQITAMSGVNTLFNALVNDAGFKALDFSKFKVAVAGGMAMQLAVAEKWKDITGTAISEGYGLTESSPVVTMSALDGTAKIGYIGLPIPSTDVRIVADDGTVLGINEPGEIQVKGPQVMKGYYCRPEETAKVIVDGWLCTGDIGIMEADGYFKIVDRKKDMILVSGFNVFPNEIEDVIALHPKVLEVACIGVPNEKSGECVKVFIVKNDKSLNKDEVITHCRENLTGYKVPKEVDFIDALPKSNVGKILRKDLRTL